MSKLIEVLGDAGRRVANATGIGKQAEPETLKCTYCGGTKFFGGPEGGMSQNVLCANDQCRHWFNWTPALNLLEDLHKVEPTPDEAAKAAAARAAQEDSENRSIMEEGAKAYLAGQSPFALIAQDRRYTYVQWNTVYRLAGYIEAMQQEIAHLRELVQK